MDYMTELAAIANKNGGIIETKTAAQRGISKAMLYKLCKAEKIHRIVKGQYVLPEDMQDELLSISRRSGKIIFSHETALFLHGISDRKTDQSLHLFYPFSFRSLIKNFREVPLKPNASLILFSKYRV